MSIRHDFRHRLAVGLFISAFIISLVTNIWFYKAADAQRIPEPRIKPLAKSEWSDAQREFLAPLEEADRLFNVFTTVARHPDLARDFNVFAFHILERSTLPPRDRELLILRIGWLCQSEYEWAQHTRLALTVGLTQQEINRIIDGPEAPSWSDHDALLLRAVDELHEDAFIKDETWDALAQKYSEKQMMDLVFTVGQYNLVSMALNSFGVQLDEGLTGFPE